MTIETLTPGELLTVRVYKALVQRPDLVWANSYELRVKSGESSAEGSSVALAAANILSDFEQQYHLNDVRFDRAVVSSFVEDGTPYNPLTFVSVPFQNKLGGRGTATEPMPLQVCLLVRREVQFGRSGRLMYRRALLEGEVTSPSGTPGLTSEARTALSVQMNNDFAQMLTSLSNEGVELVMAKGAAFGPGVQVRAVVDMEPAGVSVKKFNNRYFDRA